MKATVQLESEPIYISTTESLRMMISLLKYNVTLWKHYSPGSPLSVKAWKRIQFSFPGNLFPPAYSSSSASVRLLRKLSVHFARNNFCNCCWPKTTIARIFLFIRYGTVLRQDCFFSFLWFHRHLLFHHNLRLLLDHAGDGLDLGYQGTIQQSKQNSISMILHYLYGFRFTIFTTAFQYSLLTSFGFKKKSQGYNEAVDQVKYHHQSLFWQLIGSSILSTVWWSVCRHLPQCPHPAHEI